MKLAVARGITYSITAGLALVALKATPTLPPRQRTVASAVGADQARPLTIPGRTPTIAVAPVVVTAKRLDGVDTVILGGTIHSSLMASLDHVGETEIPKGQRRSLAWTLADIFEHKIDMSRDLSDGDHFRVLVERLQKPNGKIIINRILGAKFAVGEREFEAVHFKSENSSSEWFDAHGKSLTASFLRAPLAFRRISSSFGRREHPIFGTWRNHTGTDYAAEMGTPVRSIGDGVVISAGWQGGYGRVVDIRHANGYISRYGHLARFGNSIHPGKRVTMGSTIGYVGMTGWATGPHLHFEIRVNGVARDPRSALRNLAGDPLSGSEYAVFRKMRRHMSSLTDSDAVVSRLE